VPHRKKSVSDPEIAVATQWNPWLQSVCLEKISFKKNDLFLKNRPMHLLYIGRIKNLRSCQHVTAGRAPHTGAAFALLSKAESRKRMALKLSWYFSWWRVCLRCGRPGFDSQWGDFFNHHVCNGFGDRTVSFIFFYSLHLFIFFLPLFTFENERRKVGFSTWTVENKQLSSRQLQEGSKISRRKTKSDRGTWQKLLAARRMRLLIEQLKMLNCLKSRQFQ
jgi:hypothetical protein